MSPPSGIVTSFPLLSTTIPSSFLDVPVIVLLPIVISNFAPSNGVPSSLTLHSLISVIVSISYSNLPNG